MEPINKIKISKELLNNIIQSIHTTINREREIYSSNTNEIINIKIQIKSRFYPNHSNTTNSTATINCWLINDEYLILKDINNIKLPKNIIQEDNQEE